MKGGRNVPPNRHGAPDAAAPAHLSLRPRFLSVRKERGIALLLVLWLLVLLSVIALSFSGTARTQAQIARNLEDNAKARWMADAGVRLAVRQIWRAGADNELHSDGRALLCRFQTGTLIISVQDVSGLIDLNAASIDTLASLLVAAGTEERAAHQLAVAVADFRDPDDIVRPDGAEAEDYAEAGLAHRPKNTSFQAIEELEQVKGMTPEILDRIRAAVTVYSRRPTPEMHSAPPLVRSALGEPETRTETTQFHFRRRQQDTFAVRVTALTASGALFGREAVISVSGAPAFSFKILHWRQARTPVRSGVPDDPAIPPC